MAEQHQFTALNGFGELGLYALELAGEYRRVRDRYRPGQLEYEHATGAIMALDQLADRATLLLTAMPEAGAPAANVVPLRRTPRPIFGRDLGDETGGAA